MLWNQRQEAATASKGPFAIRYGKWGAYHWDESSDSDMTLQEVCDTLNDQAAEIEQLQAVVDKLPKTADGVPIYPGLRVRTFPLPSNPDECRAWTVLWVQNDGIHRSHACAGVDSDGQRFTMPADHLYSTPEAAVAAGGDKPQMGGHTPYQLCRIKGHHRDAAGGDDDD